MGCGTFRRQQNIESPGFICWVWDLGAVPQGGMRRGHAATGTLHTAPGPATAVNSAPAPCFGFVFFFHMYRKDRAENVHGIPPLKNVSRTGTNKGAAKSGGTHY